MSIHETTRSQSRLLYIKNLNYNTSGTDLYNLFGKYGPIRQIRLGDSTQLKTKGTAFVVYEEMNDAKQALDHLNGYHLNDRYIVVLYHMPSRQASKTDLARREQELKEIKERHNIQD
ncbi:unnamed protein product [Sympodiomycopsis kandeliae]